MRLYRGKDTQKNIGKKQRRRRQISSEGSMGGGICRDRERHRLSGIDGKCCPFEEDVRYRTIIGDARMVRMGEAVSGDSFTVMHMESGQTVLSLSDGMGSGEKAEKESNRIIGPFGTAAVYREFNRQSAIRLIHSVVLSGSEPHTYSTLDLANPGFI